VVATHHDAIYWLIGEQHEIYGATPDGNLIQNTTFFLEPHHLVRLDYYAKSNRDDFVALQDSDAKSRLAQSFEIPIDSAVSRLRVYLSKSGDPQSQLTATLHETDSTVGWALGSVGSSEIGTTTVLASGFDEPGTVLATSEEVNTGALAAGYRWVDFVFDTPATLSANTAYFWQVETDAATDDDHHMLAGVDSSSPSYAEGEAFSFTTHWTRENADAIFEVYQ
jgi:hypothetical protein